MYRYVALTLLLSCLSVLAGCDSNDSNDTIPLSEGNEKRIEESIPAIMEANIGGVQWTASTATANSILIEGILSLSIRGRADTQDVLTFVFVGQIAERTYIIGDGHLASISFLPGGAPSNDAFVSTFAGAVTFTEVSDDRLVGSFAFQAVRPSDERPITAKSGSFNVGFGVIL